MVSLPTQTKKKTMPGLEKVLELLLLKLTERKEKLSIIGHMSEIITFQGLHGRQDRFLAWILWNRTRRRQNRHAGYKVASKVTHLRIVMNKNVEPRHGEREQGTSLWWTITRDLDVWWMRMSYLHNCQYIYHKVYSSVCLWNVCTAKIE